MDINATLFGQAITFGIFVWFTLKYVWPPMTKALDEREQKIADGLAAAQKGQESLVEAEQKITELFRTAKIQASETIEQARKRAVILLDEAKEQAQEEAERISVAALAEVEQEVNRAREALRKEVGQLTIAGLTKVLQTTIDQKMQDALLERLSKDIQAE